MLKLKSSIVFFILLVLLNSVNAQNISVKMKEILILGNDENLTPEYLFYRINHICSDQSNNIYVSQENLAKIRVFDRNGKIITSIGKKGQGPGEILEATSMTVAPNNDLIVVDRLNRRITRYSNLGRKFKTYRFIEEHHIDPWNIFPLNSDLFLLNYLKKSNYQAGITEDDKIFHVYNSNFSKIIESFTSVADIWDFNQPFLKSIAGTWFLRICIVDSEKIIIAPGFYDGQLLIYKKEKGEWNLRKVSGKISKYKSYKLLNPSDYSNKKYPRYYMKNGKFLIVQQNLSRGIFVLNNGNIIHFTSTQKNNKVKNFVELFDRNGNYIGYSLLNELIDVLWKDKDDNFYCRTVSEQGFSIIKVFKLYINLR